MNHVYEIEADVMYVAKGRRPIWLPERLNVIGNGTVTSAMRKAKRALMKRTTLDQMPADPSNKFLRRAWRVKITSVEQGIEVDVV